MLDVGDHPQRDAGAVRPAQRRPVDRAANSRSGRAPAARRPSPCLPLPACLRPCEPLWSVSIFSPCHAPELLVGAAPVALILARWRPKRELLIMAQIVGGFGVPHTPVFPMFVKRDGPDCEIAKLFGAQKDELAGDPAGRHRDVRHRPSQHLLPRQPADLRARHRQDLPRAERRAADRAELRGAVGARSRRAYPRRPASRPASTSA